MTELKTDQELRLEALRLAAVDAGLDPAQRVEAAQGYFEFLSSGKRANAWPAADVAAHAAANRDGRTP